MIEFSSFNDNKERKTGLELTPLIDMVFLLLIFFLLTSYYTKPAIPVVLPEAESAQVHKQPDITIVIKKDGVLILEKRTVTEEMLPDILHSLLESSLEKTVHIQADQSVRFGLIIQLMDIAYMAGAKDIFFVVEKKGKQ
ncbi:MAG: biopolymer transporter ExbD [Spirochaetales bacterium]|nr:biopolymer transporter ExbD [Spirochaetales bacterium]